EQEFLAVGEDPIWNFREVYDSFKTARSNDIKGRSALWLQSALLSEEAVRDLSLAECDNQLSRLANPPPFLSRADRTRLDEIKGQVEAHRAHLLEEVRKERATEW